MSTATLTQTIDRPVADVFGTITDVTTFPQWNPTTVSATRLTNGPIGEGTRHRTAIRGFGEQELELQDYAENRRVRLVPHSRMFTGGHLFSLTVEAGEKTRIDHELILEPKGMFNILAPFMGAIARKNLKDTAAALENYLES